MCEKELKEIKKCITSTYVLLAKLSITIVVAIFGLFYFIYNIYQEVCK